MQVSIIGHTGFIGGYLAECYKSNLGQLYSSKNIHDIANTEHDILVLAAPSGFKWKVNQNPEPDFLTISNLCELLAKVKAKRLIHLSTCDVFSYDNGPVFEDSEGFTQQPYGRHRRILETFIEQNFEKHSIIRLPTVYGTGMKKNLIFDCITGNTDYLSKVNPLNLLQWVNVSTLPQQIEKVISEDINVYHLATEPIENGDIFRIAEATTSCIAEKPDVSYDMRTIFSSTGFLLSREEVLSDVRRFLS